MENFGGYVAPMDIGAVMRGMGVAEVVESRGGRWPVGTMIAGMTGWREYLVSDGVGFDPCEDGLPPQTMLGPLGIPGLTAWFGMQGIGRPMAGDVVIVSGRGRRDRIDCRATGEDCRMRCHRHCRRTGKMRMAD